MDRARGAVAALERRQSEHECGGPDREQHELQRQPVPVVRGRRDARVLMSQRLGSGREPDPERRRGRRGDQRSGKAAPARMEYGARGEADAESDPAAAAEGEVQRRHQDDQRCSRRSASRGARRIGDDPQGEQRAERDEQAEEFQ